MAIVVEDFFGRARREEGAYREYATDEQRRLGEKRPTAMVMNGATDPLVPSGAVSRTEFDRAVADHQKSLAEIEVRKARIGESEAELEVVKNLVEAGQPFPLCRS